MLRGIAIGVALVCAGASLGAQQSPLPIELPQGVGSGNVIIETATDYTRRARFTLSGLEGNLWRVGLLRLTFGLSDIADFELTGGLRDRLFITSRAPAVLSGLLRLADPNSTGAFDDIIVATKIQLLAEQNGHPGVAVRVATRLPNAKHPSGLGQDTTDAFATFIAGQSVGPFSVTGNMGLGLLGNPLRGNRRVPSFLYNGMVTRVLSRQAYVLVGLDGRTGPSEPGLESRAISRAGVVWLHGRARFEIAATLGLAGPDGNLGVAAKAGFALHPIAR